MMSDSEVLGMLSLMHKVINPRDEEEDDDDDE